MTDEWDEDDVLECTVNNMKWNFVFGLDFICK